MKKLSQRMLFLAVFAFASAPAWLGAQSLSAGQAGGGLKPSVYWVPDARPLDRENSVHNSFYGAQTGLRLGFALAPRWDVQIGLNPAGAQDRLARQRQALFGADALYLLGASDWRPFLLVGLGTRDTRPADDVGARTVDRSAAYFNAGIGLQYRWSNTFGLQADIRRVQGLGRDPASSIGLRGSENTLNFGMTWSFGKPN
jgi:Outer membrane protein beta-barrel domain